MLQHAAGNIATQEFDHLPPRQDIPGRHQSRKSRREEEALKYGGVLLAEARIWGLLQRGPGRDIFSPRSIQKSLVLGCSFCASELFEGFESLFKRAGGSVNKSLNLSNVSLRQDLRLRQLTLGLVHASD